jgi:hypothetical protein
MNKKEVKNIPASIRQKLYNLSKCREVDFNLVLVNFGLERILYRLTRSRHAKDFILKGALLFTLQGISGSRPTRDMDLLGVGRGATTTAAIAGIFRDVCREPSADDGIVFDPESVKTETIREEMEYGGVRTTLRGELDGARIALQIDVGFGDSVFPAAEIADYPTLLDLPAPRIRIYPWESVIAEKFQAMVNLGIANSRMKDFYDIWTIAQRFDFSGMVLAEAIEKTFKRRKTPLPQAAPIALTRDFGDDAQKKKEWNGFLKRTKLKAPENLTEVIGYVASFIMPLLQALVEKRRFDNQWSKGGPWRDVKKGKP